MKVKMVTSQYPENVESAINKFIEDKEVIDIKLSTSHLDLDGSGVIDTVAHSALIMYKE